MYSPVGKIFLEISDENFKFADANPLTNLTHQ